MEDLVITLEDLHTVRKGQKDGYCLPGLKRWASANGFSMKILMRNGIKLSQIPNHEDPYVKELVAVAKARIAAEARV